MDKTTIIVVEDNIVYCEFVCNMLAREGYRTVKAYHLSTAKKHLQQATDNDIVVADLRLPDGNGIDLLRWMRKEGKMQPFIIMTDYAEVNTAVYNPQIQISAESETKRSIFREKDKTKRSKKESAQHSKSRNKSFVMTSVSAL